MPHYILIQTLVLALAFAMKTAYLSLLCGVILLLAVYSFSDIKATPYTLDIIIKDIQLTFSYKAAALIVFLFLGNAFSIGGLIGTKFQRKKFWWLSIAFGAADLFLLFLIFE
jgi:hypothetical protein